MLWSALGSTIVSKLETSGYGTMKILIPSLEYAHSFAFWVYDPKAFFNSDSKIRLSPHVSSVSWFAEPVPQVHHIQ